MNLIDSPVMSGEMCDYDFELLQIAEKVLDHLRERPDFRWWNKLINFPKSIRDSGETMRDSKGYNPFSGWDDFIVRNVNHPVSQELCKEFNRVFGRQPTLFDL